MMSRYAFNRSVYAAPCHEGVDDEYICQKETFAAIASVVPDVINGITLAVSIEPQTESPIEVFFGVAFIRCLAAMGLKFSCCDQHGAGNCDARHILVMPQYEWRSYRIDWAVKVPFLKRPFLFVECDGREFHSSDAQILRDKQKDRLASEAGIPMFRFSGSDLDRNAGACARIVFDAIEQQYFRERQIALRSVIASKASSKCHFKVELRIAPDFFGRAALSIEEFHRERGLDVRQGPAEWRYENRHEFVRWYFQTIDDADAFRIRFGGHLICSSAP